MFNPFPFNFVILELKFFLPVAHWGVAHWVHPVYIKQLGFFADLIAIENSSLHLKEKSVIIATLFAASQCDKRHDKFNYNSANMTNCLQSKSLWKGKFCDNHGRQIDLADEIANHFKNGHYSVRTYPQEFFSYFPKGNIKKFFKNAWHDRMAHNYSIHFMDIAYDHSFNVFSNFKSGESKFWIQWFKQIYDELEEAKFPLLSNLSRFLHYLGKWKISFRSRQIKIQFSLIS